MVGGGMRASDIGGAGGSAATPAPGPSPQQRKLPLLPAQPQGISGDACVGGSGKRGRRRWWGGGDEGIGYLLRRQASSDACFWPVAAAAPASVVACVFCDCHGGECRRFSGYRADGKKHARKENVTDCCLTQYLAWCKEK